MAPGGLVVVQPESRAAGGARRPVGTRRALDAGMARGYVLPVFAVGGDGRCRIRPIHVEDLALDASAWPEDRIVDAVGPERPTLVELVGRIREAVPASSECPVRCCLSYHGHLAPPCRTSCWPQTSTGRWLRSSPTPMLRAPAPSPYRAGLLTTGPTSVPSTRMS